jgi:predicted TIM-barrel fold metal-dependent hydrolase
MDRSRRNFLMTMGMATAAAETWAQTQRGRDALPSSEGLEPFKIVSTPDEAPALPPADGPWKKLRAVQQKKVIDFNAHNWETPTQGNTEEHAQMRGQRIVTDFTAQLIQSMDRLGIAKTNLSVLSAWPQDFETMKEASSKYPGRFTLMGSTQEIWPKPNMTETVKILRQQLSSGGAKGIGEGGLPSWKKPEDLKPVMDLAREFNVPVFSHTGPAATLGGSSRPGPYQAAWRGAERWAGLPTTYPDVKLVMIHMGGPYILDVYEWMRIAYFFDNVYVDTSKRYEPEIITRLVREIGSHKVLYGSDWNRPAAKTYGLHALRSQYQQWYSLNAIAEADISEDERDMILYKNAMRLLKLSN